MVGFLAFVIIVVLGVVGLVGGLTLVRDRRQGRDPGRIDPGVSTGRLDGIESALASIESRLDDLQEQQRFLERLLEERPAPRSLRAPEPRPTEQGGEGGEESVLFDMESETGEDR